MPKIQSPRKIRVEDFKADQQELVGKLGDSINIFMDETYNALNKRLDSDNLDRQITDVIVQTNASGALVAQPQVRLTVLNKVRGLQVINALNQTNSSVYPTSQPFISWTLNGNILTILNVTGLQNSSEYKLTLVVVV